MLTCDTYVTARTLDEAFDALAAHAGACRLVAGGTDLLPWAREGRAGDVHVPMLIDIGRIPELCAVALEGARIRLGAATPMQRFLDQPRLRAVLPCMPHCTVWFADDQIREQATLGGTLDNASPAAAAYPPLLALGAVALIAARRDGKIERRRLALQDFYRGPNRTALEPDEILVAVECDALPGYGGSFQKVGHRRSLVISVACVAAVVRLDASRRRFDDVRLAVAGVGPSPQRLADVEASLRGAPIDARTIDRAAAMRLDLVQSRTRQDYRRGVLRGFIARALTEAAAETGAEVESVSADLEAMYA